MGADAGRTGEVVGQVVGGRKGSVEEADEGLVAEVEMEAEVKVELRLEEVEVAVEEEWLVAQLLLIRGPPDLVLQLLSLRHFSTCKGTSSWKDVHLCFCFGFGLCIDNKVEVLSLAV